MSDLATVLAEERAIMEGYAPHYDAAMLTNAYVYRLERAAFADWIVQTMRAAGHEPTTATVLDAGCGTGSMMALLAERGCGRLTGLDFVDGMLGAARTRGIDGARWVRATIEDPPFAPAAFDAIVACLTIHHLHDPAAFFRLVDRALRPGGWFFVLDYNGASGAIEPSGGGARRALGDVVRSVFARKNRRVLTTLPALPALFNSAHRMLAFDDIRRMVPDPSRYELRRVPRGVLLPALLPVLVEASAFDRAVARCANAVDRVLEPRVGGLFQWVRGRRRPFV